jgi:glycosyltransferase involved in cell wall biosynthesis
LLLESDYLFVYADGLNRFYVACEHLELVPAFKYPPNFFDQFEKAQYLAESLWVKAIEARAAEAEARVTMALAALADANVRMESLLKSTSWRLTEPLRMVSRGIRRLRSLFNRTFLHVAAGYIASRAILRGTARGALASFPATKLRIKHLMRSAPPGECAHPAVPMAGEQAQPPARRLRLAYVSPLPPVRSGISYYSADLLPALARFYDIDVILEQATLSDDWIKGHCGVRDCQWLLQNPAHYDRVLYHFGNSSYHQHMFHLLAQVPGMVVMHDFYLGDILRHLEANAVDAFALQRGLYKSHGYGALLATSVTGQRANISTQYPANFEVLQLALGVIVHSRHATQLAAKWYGANTANSCVVIPMLRQPNMNVDRKAARNAMGIQADAFVVCSFGFMGPTKLNHRLLQAWINSAIARDQNSQLVFVGVAHPTDYGEQIKQAIQTSGLQHRIHISGWNDSASYARYLMAADLAVQLRTSSQGETSAAVLDCINYGLPTIVNAYGAFAELPPDAVCMLPENFHDAQLTEAIDALWVDGQRRKAMGTQAKNYIQNHHAPDVCAEQYAQAIERTHSTTVSQAQGGRRALANSHWVEPAQAHRVQMAQTLARQVQTVAAGRQLLIDVSVTCRNDIKTGIQRVVRALVWSLIQTPPEGFRVEPVYLKCDTGRWQYCYARKWTAQVLGIAGGWMSDDPVDGVDGDILLIADFTSELAVEANKAGVFSDLKEIGVRVHFFVYDLLPIQMPHCFPPGQLGFSQWLHSLSAMADGAICISRAVAQDLQGWMADFGSQRSHALGIEWFHLGADLVNSIPSTGLPPDAATVTTHLKTAPSFLMVGTIEPRKGYLQTLQAFSQLWEFGWNLNLVIVGREGWVGLPDSQRQTIPRIVQELKSHPELGKRLLWLSDVSDEYLAQLYAHSDCLIAASEGEGFGLPLIEAAQHALPIIARDIPVFKEVAGDHAHYFNGLEAQDLASAVEQWLVLQKEQQQPASHSMPWLTWAQSTERVLALLQIASPKEADGLTDDACSAH